MSADMVQLSGPAHPESQVRAGALQQTDVSVRSRPAADLRGRKVHLADGAKLGSVVWVYLDDDTGRPTWAAVRISWFGRTSLVPLSVAHDDGDAIIVPFSYPTIKHAPRGNAPSRHIGRLHEALLSEHYGLTAGGATADWSPAGAPPA